jgi:hypothetical protein
MNNLSRLKVTHSDVYRCCVETKLKALMKAQPCAAHVVVVTKHIFSQVD